MEFDVHSHRHGLTIMKNDTACTSLWNEIEEIIKSITEEDIIKIHTLSYQHRNKSISSALNVLFKERFILKGWASESYIFNDSKYINRAWRLDFAKENVSLEVGFNHSGTIAWNLMKPVIASELNHVQKAIQTKIGIIISATQELKMAGGFDSAIGTYEQYIDHLNPLRVQLTTPLVIIGLRKPKDFFIKLYRIKDKTLGKVHIKPSKLKLKLHLKNGYHLKK
ncbi:restriction endonuclease BglII [Planomicrobium soli]|uniref:Restriction endonuclease BglII n=1 Tax=Planomicrobium soli TaxID=1176648 RepID=A0A2P8GQI3_9BACL|nr:BglII/BstYI family type II restriction endonuclease [Planomicrobium soli]PSL36231.1 restriction endonuclease BglII [Planomicrobium soli]